LLAVLVDDPQLRCPNLFIQASVFANLPSPYLEDLQIHGATAPKNLKIRRPWKEYALFFQRPPLVIKVEAL